jgi:hypothetical protein
MTGFLFKFKNLENSVDFKSVISNFILSDKKLEAEWNFGLSSKNINKLPN